MSKIKLLVEIDEEDYKAICSDKGYSYANTMWWIIRNGTPYNPTGDLISREALIKAVSIKFYTTPYYEHILDLIDTAPSVDLWQMRQEATENALKKAEVLYDRPQGEWEKDNIGIYCSVCKMHLDVETPFCPLCGADMRKGGAE